MCVHMHVEIAMSRGAYCCTIKTSQEVPVAILSLRHLDNARCSRLNIGGGFKGNVLSKEICCKLRRIDCAFLIIVLYTVWRASNNTVGCIEVCRESLWGGAAHI